MDTTVSPALLALVGQEWVDQAIQEFENGKVPVSFGTDSKLRKALEARPRSVYFKPTGFTEIRFRAELLGIGTENEPTKRLTGSQHKQWKFYYTFRNLRQIAPVALANLRRYPTNNLLRNDVQSSCLIVDPYAD
jgi:hypothetical protein